MKKGFCLIVTFFLIFFLVVDCGLSQSAAYKEEVIIAPHAGFTTQDVQNCGATVPLAVFYSVFDTLVKLDVETGKLLPKLATSWEAISDTAWKFKLRDDVYFHDGTHFTAEDVKFTVERGMNQTKTIIHYGGVKAVDVVDDYTVIVELKSPDHDFVNKLTDTRGSMLSKKAFETLSDEEANQIGTGAFKYDKWVEGDYITIVRNDNYWGNKPNTKRLTFKTMTEATTRLVALQTGEVDLIADPNATDHHFFEEDDNIKLLEYLGSKMRFVAMNTRQKPLDDVRVRRAIAYGVNRDDYVTVVFEGNAKPHYNYLHPTNDYYIDGPMGGFEYNPEKAKNLLAEAGYPNGVKIPLIGPQENIFMAINSVFQAQMAEIGIDLDVQNLEVATFISSTEGGNFTMCTDYTAQFFNGLDRLMRIQFYAAPGKINFFGQSHPRLNELVELGVKEFDEAKRKEIYTEIQHIIFDELCCLVPLTLESLFFGAAKNLEGLPTPGAYPDYTYVCVKLD